MSQYAIITKVNGSPYLELRQKKSRRKLEISIANVCRIEENFTLKRYALIRFLNDRYAFINESGEKIHEYDKVESLKSEGFKGYLVAKFNKRLNAYFWGYVDEELNEVIPPNFDVHRKLQWGYCFYDVFDSKRDTIYILQKDGKVEKVR